MAVHRKEASVVDHPVASLVVRAGWVYIIGGYLEEQVRISELIKQGRDDELPEGWDSDGASGIFTLFFGFVFPLVYVLFWFAIYGLSALVRMPFRSKNGVAGGQ